MIRSAFALVAALVCSLSTNSSQAAIIFQANGSNLEVVNTSSIQFTATAGNTFPFFDVHLRDVWTSAQPTGFVTGSTTAPLTLAGPFTSTTAGVAGIVVSGSVDANDLVLTWNFGTSRTVAIGDTITFGPGVYTLPNFLSNRPLPNTSASIVAVVFNTDTNTPLSNPVNVQLGATAIPEPATLAVVGGLALAGLAGYRRRKAKAVA